MFWRKKPPLDVYLLDAMVELDLEFRNGAPISPLRFVWKTARDGSEYFGVGDVYGQDLSADSIWELFEQWEAAGKAAPVYRELYRLLAQSSGSGGRAPVSTS